MANTQYPPGRASIAALVAAICAALVLLWLWAWSSETSSAAAPPRWGEYQRMRTAGRVDEARGLISDLRRDWADELEARIARLDAADSDLDRIDALIEAGRSRIRSEATFRNRLEQFEELQALRKRRPERPEGVAARVLLSELAELRLAAVEAPPSEQATDAVVPLPAMVAELGQVVPTTGFVVGEGAADADALEVQLAQVAELRDAERWLEAVELLGFAVEGSAQADAVRLEEAGVALRRAMRNAVDEVLEQARQRSAAAEPIQVEDAIAILRDARSRFPTGPAFEAIEAELIDYEDWLRRLRAAPTYGVDPSEQPTELATVRQLEERGDFGDAVSALEAMVRRLRTEDPLRAQELLGRQCEIEWIATFQDQLAGLLRGGAVLSLRHRHGGRFELGLDQSSGVLVAASAGEVAPVAWSQLDPHSVESLVEAADLSPRAWAASGALAMYCDDLARAERLFAAAVKRDPELQIELDPLIAWGRREHGGIDGYQLVDGGFRSRRELRLAGQAAALAPEIRALERKSAVRREQGLDEVLARGPAVAEATIVALRDEARRVADRLEQSAFRRQWAALAERRRLLDDARVHAATLIFDRAAYFYPYRPPAVSADRAEQYLAVQAQVDARVDALRALWFERGPATRVPAGVLGQLEWCDWLLGLLEEFGEAMPDVESRLAWLRALPDGRVDLRNFCWDLKEAARFADWQRIREFNRRQVEELSDGEAWLAEFTNQYRVMFGQPPLVINPNLVKAARGHAEEMGRLGYFGHFSPVPERRSPFDRMRLAGYRNGSSENISSHSVAERAMFGWLHSSGHHRNLLSRSDHEFGVGHDGDYWVLNFGGGRQYQLLPGWRQD